MIRHIEHGAVLELRLDRPPANALVPELVNQLASAVRAASDGGVRALVLSGREGMFSGGLDVPELIEASREEVHRTWSELFGLLQALATSPIPTAAAITGHAPAGGCVIALYCDQRIMARGRFKIGLNEVSVGVRLPRPIIRAAQYVLGRRRGERLCTQAELFDADAALALGLVDEVTDPDAVVARAIEWAQGMAKLPPNTLRKTRALARAALAKPFDNLDEDQVELFLDEWFAPEAQGALRALVERLSSKQKQA